MSAKEPHIHSVVEPFDGLGGPEGEAFKSGPHQGMGQTLCKTTL